MVVCKNKFSLLTPGRGSRGIALLIFNLCHWIGVVNLMSQLCYVQE
jgi:hypothetical protein